MLIITAVGPDQPGMAHAVALALAEADCNIEDTTMTRLSGEFAMILIVSPPEGTGRDEIATMLTPLEASHGLFISCRTIGNDEIEAEDIGARYIVSVYGPEAKGLLARVTGMLARRRINITDVQTRVASAGAVYIMILEVELPAELDAANLQADLQGEAGEAGLQLSLRALEEEVI